MSEPRLLSPLITPDVFTLASFSWANIRVIFDVTLSLLPIFMKMWVSYRSFMILSRVYDVGDEERSDSRSGNTFSNAYVYISISSPHRQDRERGSEL